jgi:signal transduction histidine kinase
MSLFSLTSLMIFIASIGFGSFLYYGNRKSKVNQAWFLTSASISIWGLALFGVTTATTNSVALAWQYLLDIVASFIPVFYYIFISRFIGLNNRKGKIITLTFGLSFALFSVSSYFKGGVQTLESLGFFWVDPGSLYFLFPLFFLVTFIVSLVELFKEYLVTKEQNRRSQILSVLIAGGLGLGAGSTNFFPQLFNIYPFGNYFLLLYIFIMSIGVLRHKLFNTKVVSAKLFSGGLVLILLFNLLAAQSITDWFFASFIFFAVLFFSYFLVRSVDAEVRTREEIEKLAKDLRIANTRLNKISMLKTEFVSLATHQLRSPLTAIKGYISMILEGSYGPVEEKMKEPLERVFNSTGTLTQVVQDFLDVSRIEQGSMKYDMKAFSLKELAEEIVNEQSPNIKKALLEFSFHFMDDDETGARYLVYGDRSKLKQVVANLIDNALKYTKNGFIKIRLSYTSNTVVLEVSDSGMGIDKKTLGVLFQKFERADKADEVNVQGTGLGLYIAKQIVEAHNGTIRAFSEGLGRGSIFSVELKRKEF